MKLLAVWVALACVGAAAATSSLPRITTRADSPFMYDPDGRVRIFHGVNSVYKAHPWYPAWLLNESVVQGLAERGFTAVRLGWIFNGVMPSPGQVNMTYVHTQQAVVNMLAKYGIHALLDAHQDVLSSKFCLYDSWPQWVIDRCTTQHAFPWPFKGGCDTRQWGENELTEAAATCYQEIYNNSFGIRDAYAQFWGHSASLWNGNTDVLGFELMNEPFAGDVYKDPLLFLPGVAGHQNLQPFYDALATVIHAANPDVNLFMEPVVWGMIFNSTTFGSGFTHPPGGSQYANRTVYSYHYYCSSFGGDAALCNDVVAPLVFEAVRKDVKTLGGSSMMTEWGLCGTAGQYEECVAVADMADANLQSWTEWGTFTQSGSYSEQEMLALTRTYTRVFAGQPVNMTFNATTLVFDTCWTLDTSIKAPTEVFVPIVHRYKSPPSVTATPTVTAKLNATTQTVLAYPAPTSTDGQLACIHIQP